MIKLIMSRSKEFIFLLRLFCLLGVWVDVGTYFNENKG